MFHIHLTPSKRTFDAIYQKIRHNGTCMWKVICTKEDYRHEYDKAEGMEFDLIRIDQARYNPTALVNVLWGSNTDQNAVARTYRFECVWECVGCKCYVMASDDHEMLQQLHQLYHFPILDGVRLHGDCIVFYME